MAKKTASTVATTAPAPRRPARSVFRRTSSDARAGLGFFTGTSHAFHHRSGMNVSKTACVIIATALQHGLEKVIQRILHARAVLGNSGAILTREEVADALRAAKLSGEIMYVPIMPNSTIHAVVDAEHEGVLVTRTKKSEAAQLKREKAKKAKADAEKAAGSPQKKTRKAVVSEEV